MVTFCQKRYASRCFSENKQKNSMKMVRNKVIMTTESTSFINLCQLGFWLWPNNRKTKFESETITALVSANCAFHVLRSFFQAEPNVLWCNCQPYLSCALWFWVQIQLRPVRKSYWCYLMDSGLLDHCQFIVITNLFIKILLIFD